MPLLSAGATVQLQSPRASTTAVQVAPPLKVTVIVLPTSAPEPLIVGFAVVIVSRSTGESKVGVVGAIVSIVKAPVPGSVEVLPKLSVTSTWTL